jgi:ATP-binding cassette subfamily B protein
MIRPMTNIGWPATRLSEAIEALARQSGLPLAAAPLERAPAQLRDATSPQIGAWIEAAARALDLEAEPVEVPFAEVEQFIGRAGPAIFHLAEEPDVSFLMVLAAHGRQVTVLTPDLKQVQVSAESVRTLVCRPLETPAHHAADHVIAQARLAGKRAQRARQAILHGLLAAVRVGGCWLLRTSPAADFRSQAGEARLPQLFFTLLASHAGAYALWLLSWGILGWGVLNGRLDFGWLLAWMLVLVTMVPLRLLTTFLSGLFSIRAGTILKRRLLVGGLKLDPDEVRHLGAGQLLGQVLESEVVEAMALTGGFLGITAALELIFAGVVLGAGAGSLLLVLLLLGTTLGALLLGRSYYRRRKSWTQHRLEMTNDLVERMIGHRTRLAQEARAHWNDGEDQALERYLGLSQDLDARATWLQVLVPRGWFIAGLLGLAPAFIAGGEGSATLAIAVGGIILAYRALRNLMDGCERLTAVAIAWDRIKPFWLAAARRERVGQPRFAVSTRTATMDRADHNSLMDIRDVVFRYPARHEAVLGGLNLRIHDGDRLLLEGPSGGGKSTLATMLAACRTPDAGLLLLRGLDRETLGAHTWRRQVVLVPQFHENHVLTGTFAFNALMGRGWPPSDGDFQEVINVCRSLGLGPLLARMPAGPLQMVGETGWQLSHGERSRLYMARALLQGGALLILDESFAALDPQTLRQTLTFVLERASTVLVIAHP